MKTIAKSPDGQNLILTDLGHKLVIVKIGDSYYPAKDLGAPTDCLLSAIYTRCNCLSVIDLAQSLPTFGVTLDECLTDNRAPAILLSMIDDAIMRLRNRPHDRFTEDRVEDLERMALGINQNYPTLSGGLLALVDTLRKRIRR